jgi:hypothetical protein
VAASISLILDSSCGDAFKTCWYSHAWVVFFAVLSSAKMHMPTWRRETHRAAAMQKNKIRFKTRSCGAQITGSIAPMIMKVHGPSIAQLSSRCFKQEVRDFRHFNLWEGDFFEQSMA